MIFIHQCLPKGKSFFVGLLCATLLFTVSKGYAEKEKEHTKKGWSIVPVPTLYYNSDQGLLYGVFCDVFHFGNGTMYPDYRHRISADITRSTQNSGIFRLFYDSEYLLPNRRITADICYLQDNMLDFYGFNGYSSPYITGQNKSFYKMSRDMFRLTIDFQQKINSTWAWTAGIGYYNYQIGKAKKYKNEISLYQLYRDNGVIADNEARGGNIIQLKAGAVYDSRDTETDPTRGLWGEAILYGSPDIIDRKGYTHLKFTMQFRQYIPVWGRQVTFAYRAGYQATLAGNAPFYVQSNINTLYMRQTYSEGLGGTSTLRGILRNRVVGNSMAWVNTELRYRFLNFQLLRQNWYFVINPLFDAGMVVTPYKKSELKNSGLAELYRDESEYPHLGVGAGAKMVMNNNFVLSFEWGHALDKRDGTNGFNFCLNFLF